jgi:hypothetical protein
MHPLTVVDVAAGRAADLRRRADARRLAAGSRPGRRWWFAKPARPARVGGGAVDVAGACSTR